MRRPSVRFRQKAGTDFVGLPTESPSVDLSTKRTSKSRSQGTASKSTQGQVLKLEPVANSTKGPVGTGQPTVVSKRSGLKKSLTAKKSAARGPMPTKLATNGNELGSSSELDPWSSWLVDSSEKISLIDVQKYFLLRNWPIENDFIDGFSEQKQKKLATSNLIGRAPSQLFNFTKLHFSKYKGLENFEKQKQKFGKKLLRLK